MKTFLDWLRFLRFPNLFVVGLLIFFLQIKCSYLHCTLPNCPVTSDLFWPLGCILTLGLISLTAAGNIINDLFDVRADKINKPDKVFINRLIEDDKALLLYLGLNIVALVCAIYCVQGRWSMLTVFPVMVGILYFYSFFMKRLPLLSNIVIAGFCAGVPLTYAWVIGPETDYPLSKLTWTLAFFAFVSTFIREIIKDCEDVNGDKVMDGKTLPIVLGFQKTNFIISVLLLVLIGCTIALANQTGVWAYSVCVLPLIYALYGIQKATDIQHYKLPSNALKVYMLMGIIGVVL